MRAYLAHFLILLLLLGNLGWAADYDGIFFSSDEQNTTRATQQNDTAGTFNTDHCYHGAAHYLGILSDQTPVTNRKPLRFVIGLFNSAYFNILQPPTPPPNA